MRGRAVSAPLSLPTAACHSLPALNGDKALKASLGNTFRLLKSHARPHLWTLVLVIFLGGLTAMGTRGVYLLLTPTWNVIFPGASSVASVPEELIGAESSAAAEESWSAEFRRNATAFLLGTDDVASADPMQLLWRVAIVISIIAVLTALAQYAFIFIGRWVALRMVVSLRMQIARHLMGLSVRYHGERRFGDLLSRVSADVTTTLSVLQHSLRNLVQEPLTGIASLIYAFAIAPKPTLFVVVGMPLLAVPISILARKIRRGSTKSHTELGASVQVFSQMFQGVRTVKAFRAEEREMDRYRAVNESFVRKTLRMVHAVALSTCWATLYSHIGMGAMLLMIGWVSIRGGELQNGGDMATFFLLISGVYSNIKATTKGIARASESAGAAARLQELLDQAADIVERPDALVLEGQKAWTGDGGLSFENVTFAYSDEEASAVAGLTLDIEPGKTLALVGPSGAGKSTVMDLIARFIDPDQGGIKIAGHDLRDLTLASWTDQYGLVGQTPFLFHASIEENIRYAKPSATDEEVEAAARAAGIHDFITGLPEGYATNVAESGTRLSGGQRQRLTLARAFLKSAPLLLLDEATSALDPESEAIVQDALDRLMADRTVVVIAHRLSTIRNADRIAVLEEGRLVEQGTHSELIAKGGSYARMHAAQFPSEAVATR